MPTVRVMIVDDHEVVRLGLKALLSLQRGFEVVAEAATVEEAVEKARVHQPDVVVLDVRLPGSSGIAACRRILQERPATRVIVLTSHAEEEVMMEAIAAGASGYLLKQIDARALVAAISTVASGGTLLDPALMDKVFTRLRAAAQEERRAALAALNEREREILALVAQGKTNKEIARAIALSEKTVRNYVSAMLTKLGLHHRSEAAAFAIEHGLGEHRP